MNEKILQTEFSRKYRPETSEVHELKITKTGRLSFSCLRGKQESKLSKIDSPRGCYHKLSDMSADYKPFDSFFLISVPAYIVACWYKPKKPKILYFIRIKDFLALRDTSKWASMTEEEAKLICEKTLEL